MERNQSGGGDPYVEATLPRELHDRVERLFREYRGYEPTSVQESLSVICDLAEAQLDTDASDATSERASSGTAPSPVADDPVDDPAPSTQEASAEQTETLESRSSSEQQSPKPDSSGTIRAAIDEVFPTDWATEADTAERLPLIVGHYLTAEGSTRIERENSALAAVGTRYGTNPERLRTEVVEDIYGADTLPGELASEFFSEALGKVEQRLERAETDVLSAVELVGGDSEQSSEARTDETGPTTTESTGSTDSPLDLGSGSTDLPAGQRTTWPATAGPSRASTSGSTTCLLNRTASRRSGSSRWSTARRPTVRSVASVIRSSICGRRRRRATTGGSIWSVTTAPRSSERGKQA
ncbi:hypothetical protein ACFQH2_13010 [Natronoarchaeum sp. GCM10025703]|uniref:hypothetical protein n=1 Tax=Natronoarchaeum sp. GCM10025703 TaxID=3252685 RepID=UPI003612210A